MREIKFRLWNDFIKKYETLQEVASRGAIMPRGNELKTTVNYPLIIEQFTGLHDKNGVEIYEGDVVRVSDDGWRDDVKAYEVYYGIEYGYPAFDLKDHTQDVNLLSYYNENGQMEVIGNIHMETEHERD